nr:MAG TPA: hypothetical protein [Caudoviricetes sp.]
MFCIKLCKYNTKKCKWLYITLPVLNFFRGGRIFNVLLVILLTNFVL